MQMHNLEIIIPQNLNKRVLKLMFPLITLGTLNEGTLALNSLFN